ncbi:hypothetical protein HY605_04375 [Candidatus Peregrinibacteria bacterium]|nr:hypothetical protein [Candidatus Peregrinibacteria bacterium]
MTNALEQGIPFNPMRFREEIKGIEESITNLEMLIKQHKRQTSRKLLEKIREEAAFLKNSLRELEGKMKEVGDTEMPYYFVRKQTKVKAEKLLQEAFAIANN